MSHFVGKRIVPSSLWCQCLSFALPMAGGIGLEAMLALGSLLTILVVFPWPLLRISPGICLEGDAV